LVIARWGAASGFGSYFLIEVVFAYSFRDGGGFDFLNLEIDPIAIESSAVVVACTTA
jgi:hypothetical protein